MRQCFLVALRGGTRNASLWEMRLLFLVFLLAACSNTESTHLTSDPEFDPYLQELEQMSLQYADRELDTQVAVNFADQDTTGKCRKLTVNGKTRREILIDRSFYAQIDRYSILATLLHEIGHCQYNRGHTTSKMDFHGSQVSRSIMGEKGVPGIVFKRNLSHYWQEFYGL